MLVNSSSSLVYTGELFVFITNLPAVATPQEKIIEQLESDIERLKIEIFGLKGEINILKKMLKNSQDTIPG